MDIKSGVEFQKYLLQTKLGDGASGEVWKARDTRQPRSVAVKIMRDYLAQSQNPIHRERFKREIAAMKQLGEHPNIPAFYEGDGNFKLPFFVMQFIGGEGMDTILDTGAVKNIPALKRVDIISQIADALSYAHNAGYIHRDIKPGNIKIIGDDTAFLMDFSVAFEEENMAETQLGIGTPLYMPPEVFPSRAGDIFSFALVAYEILYGIHAIFRPTDRITTAAEAKVLMDERLRNKTWNHPTHSPMLQPLNVDVDVVDRVFEKALSYKPEDRYQKPQEFANDLRKAVGLAPVDATPRTSFMGISYDELGQETPVYLSNNVSTDTVYPSATADIREAAETRSRVYTLLFPLLFLLGMVVLGILFLLWNREDESRTTDQVFPTQTLTELAVVIAPTETLIPTQQRPLNTIPLWTRTATTAAPVSAALATTTLPPTTRPTETITPTATPSQTLTRTPTPTLLPTLTPIPMNLEANLLELFEIASDADAYECLRFNALYEHIVKHKNNTEYENYSEQLVGADSPLTFIYTAFCSLQTDEPVALAGKALEDNNDDLITLLQTIVIQLRESE